MASTNICPFCIVANYELAKAQADRVPEEVRHAFDEGRATEDFLDKL